MWVTLILENSNKFQKTKFWKEKSVENLFKLGPTAQATLVCIEINIMFSFNIITLFLKKTFEQNIIKPNVL
jgi:hypothetical protein